MLVYKVLQGVFRRNAIACLQYHVKIPQYPTRGQRNFYKPLDPAIAHPAHPF
jgi:hypothetical protein